MKKCFKPTPASEGNATLTRAFVENAFTAIHKFMRRQRLFVCRLRLLFKETHGSTIRPISIKDSFYFTTSRTVSENLRVFLRITLKLSKKNASYQHFDARKLVSYQTKSLRMKAKDGEHGLFPKLNQKHKNSRGSNARERYLR